MSLRKGFARLQKRVHQTGQKVKKTVARLCSSSSKEHKRERNKLRKRNPAESADKSSKDGSPPSDDNNPQPQSPTEASPVNSPPHDAAVEHENPYDRVAHHLCQALVDHIRAHYFGPPSTCSCSVYSTSECGGCRSEPTTHTGATTMTNEREEATPPESSSNNHSTRRKEAKQKKSTGPHVPPSPTHPKPDDDLSIPRILSSQVPLRLPRLRPVPPELDPRPALYHNATFMRQLGYPIDQPIPVSETFYRSTKYEMPQPEHDDEYDYANIRARSRTVGTGQYYSKRICSWLRDLPEQQNPLRRKPKVENLSSPGGSRKDGLATITE